METDRRPCRDDDEQVNTSRWRRTGDRVGGPGPAGRTTAHRSGPRVSTYAGFVRFRYLKLGWGWGGVWKGTPTGDNLGGGRNGQKVGHTRTRRYPTKIRARKDEKSRHETTKMGVICASAQPTRSGRVGLGQPIAAHTPRSEECGDERNKSPVSRTAPGSSRW